MLKHGDEKRPFVGVSFLEEPRFLVVRETQKEHHRIGGSLKKRTPVSAKNAASNPFSIFWRGIALDFKRVRLRMPLCT